MVPAPKELDPSTSLAALYGTKLRKLRIGAGWTQRELGDQVPMAHNRIAQFELGNEVPPEDIDKKLDELLGAGGDLADLWGHIKRTPFPDWVRKFMGLEAKASAMHKYMAHSVPGLLQTEAYAREVLRLGQPWSTVDEIEEKVARGSGATGFLWGHAAASVGRTGRGGDPSAGWRARRHA